jgi:anti-sigma B factor antagonist
MSGFHRIAVSAWEFDGKHVAVVEILDDKLWGLTVMHDLMHELSSWFEHSQHKDVLLNLGRVEFISSAALNRLVNFQKRVQDAGGHCKLCCLRPGIEEIFVTTRFNQLFDIRRSEAEALAAY